VCAGGPELALGHAGAVERTEARTLSIGRHAPRVDLREGGVAESEEEPRGAEAQCAGAEQDERAGAEGRAAKARRATGQREERQEDIAVGEGRILERLARARIGVPERAAQVAGDLLRAG